MPAAPYSYATLPGGWVDAGGNATVLGGRYELVEPIGSGGSGTVWRAKERAGGAEVAVKIIPIRTPSELGRAQREAAALRLVQIEGVVRLLDDGVEDGRQILVMALARGAPFPGVGARDWAWLRPRAFRLLEAVAGLHRLGVIHRDLKPANVLVDEAGTVTVVDLGIARGVSIGPTVTAEGRLVGTPRYLPPEQARGDRVDARADLYAVGVMLYEALSGAPPFDDSEGIRPLLAAKASVEVVPLHRRAPGVPAVVARVVDALLARDPAARPSSAEAVLAALGGAEAPSLLPWVGGRAAVEAVLARVREGKATWVGGPAGSGRTRLLAEVTEALVREGREVRSACPGDRPLESLRPVLGLPETEGSAIAAAELDVRALLSAGVVVVVGDLARLDRWSRALVGRVAGAGAVLGVDDGAADVRLEPWSAADLRVLFHGPDVVLHLRTDGAAVLHARTGGLAARVVREVDAWVAGGAARWVGTRLSVDRVGLERVGGGFVHGPALVAAAELEAPLDELLGWIALAGEAASAEVLHRATGLPTWELEAEIEELNAQGVVRSLPDGRLQAAAAPKVLRVWSEEAVSRAHRALAAALPVGAPGRILHLAAADDGNALAEEALIAGRELLATGAATRALVVFGLGLGRLRPDASPDVARALAQDLARAALNDGSTAVLVRAAADLRGRRVPDADRLAGVLAAWAALESGNRDTAVQLAGALPPFEDLELDSFRRLVHVRAALATDPEEAARLVGADGPADLDSFLGRRRREWLGQIRLRQGRGAEAAALQLSVAAVEPVPRRRATARVNAGFALMATGDLDGADACLVDARDEAVEGRIAEVEAWARVALRQTGYRRGEALVPDPDLREAVRLLGVARMEADLLLVDAAAAWRAGEDGEAARLAAASGAAYRTAGVDRGVLLAGALGLAAGDRGADPAELVEAALRVGPPLLALQVAGLVATTGWRATPAQLASFPTIPAGAPARREAVLDPAEAWRYLREEGGSNR